MLSIGSAVFEAMFRFNDSTTENGCSNCIQVFFELLCFKIKYKFQELELVDVERESFEALLTFLYTDDIQPINKDSVMSILYTGKYLHILSWVDTNIWRDCILAVLVK